MNIYKILRSYLALPACSNEQILFLNISQAFTRRTGPKHMLVYTILIWMYFPWSSGHLKCGSNIFWNLWKFSGKNGMCLLYTIVMWRNLGFDSEMKLLPRFLFKLNVLCIKLAYKCGVWMSNPIAQFITQCNIVCCQSLGEGCLWME